MMRASVSNKIKILVRQNGVFYIFALFIAFGLKYHYSRAGSGDLVWILGPTAGLIEIVSGIQFESEANTGFVSRGYRIIIAPSCAGINFLIMAFCMAVFSGIHIIKHSGSKLLWLATSLVCAYTLTIAVNTLRIIASIYSYRADIYFGWITPARIHRLEGIIIYFFFLCLFYMIIIKTAHRIRPGAGGKKITSVRYGCRQTVYFRWACSGLIPLCWYGLITLGIPLFTGAYQENLSRFKEHSWTVICVSFTVLTVIFLIQLIRQRIVRLFVDWGYALRGPRR
jgi:exosortase K